MQLARDALEIAMRLLVPRLAPKPLWPCLLEHASTLLDLPLPLALPHAGEAPPQSACLLAAGDVQRLMAVVEELHRSRMQASRRISGDESAAQGRQSHEKSLLLLRTKLTRALSLAIQANAI